ncbi:probable G-protein coupled receptor 139 [Pristis pectinata]|uniref:probable G-protein coupled receptor 139 n=1 Tax=Pristis pectinata TaxID=685728 RepID=UPI00223D1221|nr:probable G-protein coupled receptor 139 [Pristis pectinata]
MGIQGGERLKVTMEKSPGNGGPNNAFILMMTFMAASGRCCELGADSLQQKGFYLKFRPLNLVTIVILSRGKCGLSKGVTRYLVAMATADLLVIVLDLILKQIPIVFFVAFRDVQDIPVCKIHAVLLYAATDCSVWFTVAFTFDRFVAICCQKLKTKHCSERRAAMVIGTLTVLSSAKNLFWYFMYTNRYVLMRMPWFCYMPFSVMLSRVWATVELLHYVLTPCIPFSLILALNALTVRHILVTIRIRKKLRGSVGGESQNDPEAKSRRKSITLLFLISGNFILLWSPFLVSTLHTRIILLDLSDNREMSLIVTELGFMLQLLSCCTNTFIYAATQTKFREELSNGVKYPFRALSIVMK